VMDDVTQLHFLRDRGLPSEKIRWCGLLICPAFQAAATHRTEAARGLLKTLRETHPELRKLDPSCPTLLFLGGSGCPMLERLFADPLLLKRLNVVMVCSKNEKFRVWPDRASLAQPSTSVFDFVKPELATVPPLRRPA